MSAEGIDLLCERCGQTFSEFLHEMAEQNLKVVCPKCGAEGAKPVTDTPSFKKI